MVPYFVPEAKGNKLEFGHINIDIFDPQGGNKALYRNPNFPYVYFNKGIALARTGKNEEAIGGYHEALCLTFCPERDLIRNVIENFFCTSQETMKN